MYVEASSYMNVKVVVFGLRASTVADQVWEVERAARVRAQPLGDQGGVYVFEPRALPRLTPRLHLFWTSLSTCLFVPAQPEFFRGADAVVVVDPNDETIEQARAAATAAGLTWDELPTFAMDGAGGLHPIHGAEELLDEVGATVCARLAEADWSPEIYGSVPDELRRWRTFERRSGEPGGGAEPEPAPLGPASVGQANIPPRVVAAVLGLALAVVLLAVLRVSCG